MRPSLSSPTRRRRSAMTTGTTWRMMAVLMAEVHLYSLCATISFSHFSQRGLHWVGKRVLLKKRVTQKTFWPVIVGNGNGFVIYYRTFVCTWVINKTNRPFRPNRKPRRSGLSEQRSYVHLKKGKNLFKGFGFSIDFIYDYDPVLHEKVPRFLGVSFKLNAETCQHRKKYKVQFNFHNLVSRNPCPFPVSLTCCQTVKT